MSANLTLENLNHPTTVEKSMDEISKRKRLTRNFTGASKRRFKKLLASGINIHEALELCKKPISRTVSVIDSEKIQDVQACDETFKVDITPAAKVSLLDKIKNTQGKGCEESSKFNILPAIKVGVKDTQLLSSKKLNLLKSAMLAQINKGPPTINHPDFLNCTKKEGWLCITCTNEGAKRWLYEIAPRLKPWPGAAITCMTEEDFPKACVGLAWIPGPAIETSWLLYSLTVWNKGLDSMPWRVLNTKKLKSGQRVTFSIPISSYEFLQKQNFIVNLGCGPIKIRFRKKTISKT